jgi:DNA-binding response OmpR family regulator
MTTDPTPTREARVLLVDDDRELCQMLSEYLAAEHFDVKSVHDGGEALAELQAGEFEIVILDVMLPSVGGLDVMRKLGGRANNRTPRGSAPDELHVGPITLNSGTRQVHVAEKPVALTGAEFRVLELLMRSAGQVISRDSMTEQALGRKLAAYDRSIDTHISNLRRKLELEAGKNPEIKNVRGSGYTLTWAHA